MYGKLSKICVSGTKSLVNDIKVLFTNPSARAGYDTRSIFKVL